MRSIGSGRRAVCAAFSFQTSSGREFGYHFITTQDAVDLPKMVQVVCRFQADELLDRLPSAYLVNPIALHPPCARDRLQQSQVALAQRPKDPCRKARILLCVTQALRPALPEKLFIVPAYFIH